MITIVNLNPCIDWQYSIPSFAYGGLNRVNFTHQHVGGKGINVCIASKNLGLNPLCTGFNFTENGDVLTKKLDSTKINHDFITIDAALRVNIKLYDESTGTMTELNQPGAIVPPAGLDELFQKIKTNNTKNSDILVISGSRPQGVSADFYAKLCKSWQGKVFLDADGDALRKAIDTAPPFAIKPNLFELESLFGVKLNSPEEIVEFCRKELPQIHMICVSMGHEGAVLVTQSDAWYCPALDIEVKGVQGAGDSMVAGLLYAMYNRLPTEAYLPAAIAAASASVSLDGTNMCTRKGFDTMLKLISPDMLRHF